MGMDTEVGNQDIRDPCDPCPKTVKILAVKGLILIQFKQAVDVMVKKTKQKQKNGRARKSTSKKSLNL